MRSRARPSFPAHSPPPSMRCAPGTTLRARSCARDASLRGPRSHASTRREPRNGREHGELAMTTFTFATAQYESGDWDSAPLVPPNIIDTVARYTEIEVTPTGVIVSLASPDLLRYPLVYLTGHLPVRFSDAERRQLREFLERGGMLFVDDHNHDIDGVFHKTATEEITRTIGEPKLLPNT